MNEISLSFVSIITYKLLLALICGGAIGYQREMSERPAGFRTHILVAVGSAVYMLVSLAVAGDAFDPGRIAAQVASGMGFLGAGTIIKQGNMVRGLTTAASLWAAAAIGLACGYGGSALAIAVIATLIVLLSLTILHRLERLIARQANRFAVTINLANPRVRIPWLRDLLHKRDITIGHLAINPARNGEEALLLEGTAPNARVIEEMLQSLLADPGVTGIHRDEEGWG